MTYSTGLTGALVAIAAATVAAAQTAPAPDAPASETAPPETDGAEGSGLPVFLPRAASQDGAADEAWIWGETAVLRGLDKVTATTRDFEAPVGGDTRFFALTVSVKRCAKRPPEMQPETIVGMEISDRQTDGSGNEISSKRIFSGWMFGSSPGLNPLEHPVYDVWVLDCIASETDEQNEGGGLTTTGAPTAPTPVEGEIPVE